MSNRLTDLELYQSDVVEILFESEAIAILAETRARFIGKPSESRRLARGYDVIEMRSHLAALDIAHNEFTQILMAA